MAQIQALRQTANVLGAFTAEFFTRAHATSALENNFIISRVNHGILSNNFNETGVVALTTFVTHGMMLHHHIPYRRDAFLAHVCLEILNINMPAAKMLAQAEAQALFIHCARAFAADVVANAGHGTLVDMDMPPVNAPVGALANAPIVYSAVVPQTIASISNNLRYLATSEAVTFFQSYAILLSLAPGCTNIVPSALTVLCYMVAAISKRGNVSDRFIIKFIEGVRADTGVTIPNGSFVEIIENIWRQMGNQITPVVAQALFELWPQLLPNDSIRMRSTLNQAANQGMTAFLIIGRVIRAHANFNWDRVFTLFAVETANYGNAIDAVGQNRYYGFNQNIGAVRSTNFANIAWVSKELMIQGSGDLALRNYPGWLRAPRYLPTLEALIAEYLTQMNNVNDLPPNARPEWFDAVQNNAIYAD